MAAWVRAALSAEDRAALLRFRESLQMRHSFRASIAACLVLSTGSAALAQTAPAAPTREAVVERAIESVIRPGYERLDKAGEVEAKAFTELCAKPDDAKLKAARQGFADLAQAFGAVEFIRFGPITEGSRFERYLFWPDRRGAAQRQAQIIVNRRDADAATSDLLPRKSVAVQGLTALEYVLFGNGSDALASQAGAFRCRYGATIVGNLGQISDAVAEQWRHPHGINERLTKPKPSDPTYRSTEDSLQELFATAVRGLTAIRELRILPGLNALPGETKTNLFLFGRSDHATAMLVADLDGLRALLADSGLLALKPGTSLDPAQELGAIALSIRALGPDLGQAAGTAEGEAVLRDALARIQTVETVLTNELAPALGLSADVSALDGDGKDTP
ncbi:imelysin family protein [Aureimonas sp. AU40]|uniref:imelysin family protein n=1 Tax=Aureimonas sp. AU40 TaxID=1637747 RepID=UPI0007827A92